MRAFHPINETVVTPQRFTEHRTLSPSSVSLQIREEIEQYGIKIYQFPDCDSDEDEDFKQQDTELKVRARAARCLSLCSFFPISSLHFGGSQAVAVDK